MVDVPKHSLVPKHTKLTEEEAVEVLKRLNILAKQLPRISSKDPAIRELAINKGEIIKITRESLTNKEALFYRIVAE